MSTATTILCTTRAVIKVGSTVIDYIRDDQLAKLGLRASVSITIRGDRIGIGNYKSPDGVFSFTSKSDYRVTFLVHPFQPDSSSWWNGPDIIPNTIKGGSLPASLIHDAILHHADDIATKLGIPLEQVQDWSHGILASLWRHYGGQSFRSRCESWLAYQSMVYLYRPYKRLKRWLGFGAIALSLTIVGCDSPPDWRVEESTPIVSIEWSNVITSAPPATVSQ